MLEKDCALKNYFLMIKNMKDYLLEHAMDKSIVNVIYRRHKMLTATT